MPLSFPSNPTLNQTYSYSGRTWIWNGSVWQSVGTTVSVGATGAQGVAGSNGAQGIQGPNAAITFSDTPPSSPLLGDRWTDSATGSGYTWIYDGNNFAWVELSASGYSGLQGTQGIQGVSAVGTQGLTGIQGALGLQGVQGTIGNTGVIGPVGTQGLQGLQGGGFNQAQGTQGLQGFAGPTGIQGLDGIQGPYGPYGLQGNNGPQGVQGLQGSYPTTVGVTFSNTTFTGTTTVAQLLEAAYINQSAINGFTNYYVQQYGSVTLYAAAATGNWTFNIAGNTTVPLDSMMAVGQSISLTMLTTQGASAFYQTAFQIDAVAVTPKWLSGTAPTAGNTNSLDVYSYSIVKTASATWTVIASRSKYA
jgi:Collagen triple helix repeat (20 copies)